MTLEEHGALQARGREKCEEAILHVLRFLASDPRVYYWLGEGTQSYALLTEALAASSGLELSHIRKTFKPDKKAFAEFEEEKNQMEALYQAYHDALMTGREITTSIGARRVKMRLSSG